MKRTDITFAYTIIRIALMGSLLLTFARTSLVAAAITMLISYVVMLFVNWVMLIKKTIKVTLGEYVLIFFKSWVGVAISVGFILGIKQIFPNYDSLCINTAYAVVYVLTMTLYIYIFDKDFIKSIIQLKK